MEEFTMQDYPAGYFPYKKQLNRKALANTCPSCEIGHLERFVSSAREGDPLRISSEMKAAGLRCLEDIELLRTGVIATERHRKRALHTHGAGNYSV